MTMNKDATEIFIGYRQEDSKPWAVLLCKELEDAFGKNLVFLDKDTLHAGNWRTQIQEALNQCRVVLVVIGRQWLTIKDESGLRRLDRPNDVHREEIAFALSRKDVTVIPIRVDGVAMPQAGDLPADIRLLADQQSRELSDSSARRAVDIQQLIEDIQRITGLRDNRPFNRGRGGQRLKALVSTIGAIGALSLSVWVLFYVLHLGELTSTESIVVVGICTVIVLAAKHTWARLKKRSKADELIS